MSAKIKIAVYVVLAVLTLLFGWKFHKDYAVVTAPQSSDAAPTNATVATPVPIATNASQVAALTNAADQGTNAVTAANDGTNSNVVQPAVTPPPVPAADNTTAGGAVAAAPQHGNLLGDLAGFVLAVIGLGLLIAYDVTQMAGSEAVEFLFNDKGDLLKDPEYERAEEAWANGKHLEAIQMMRDYLKKNPREQYVALRIAEIYEKDLRNSVAASLEYEEILKKKLPAERWGWAAIHLCNIYTKLGQQEKVAVLLQRIASEYPQTAAAKKARRNLGLPEPVETAAPVEKKVEKTRESIPGQEAVFDLDEAIASDEGEISPAPEEEAEEAPKPITPEPPDKSSLPKGFRPKK
jgi:TolA-binding protein